MPPPTDAPDPADGRRRRSRDLADLLGADSVRFGSEAASRDDAVRQVGGVLVASGAVDESYIDAMLDRERSVSTYVGEGIAFPHATFAGEGSVRRDAIVVVAFPGGVDWDGRDVRLAVGLAALGRGHIGILSRLASVLLDPAAAAALRSAASEADIRRILSPPR